MEDTSVNSKRLNKTKLMVIKWKTHQHCGQTAHEKFNVIGGRFKYRHIVCLYCWMIHT